MEKDFEVIRTLNRRAAVAARLKGIEMRDLVDAAVSQSRDEREAIDALARPPLGFRGIEAQVVLITTVRDRCRDNVAKLRAELEELDRVIGENR